MTLSGRLDFERLRRAARLMLDFEPILGCRFVEHWYRPYWQRWENLDELEICRLVEGGDQEEQKRLFMTTSHSPTDYPLISLLVLRAETDTICLKLNHTVGDAPAFMSYIYHLTRLYGQLATDSDPVITPVNGSRSPRQFTRTFSFWHQLRVLKFLFKGTFVRKGFFQIEDTDPEATEGQYVFHKIPAERVELASRHARDRRTTLTIALLAATQLAFRELFAVSSEDQIGVGTTIDLRNYLPPKQRETPFANLSGPTRFHAPKGLSYDEVLIRFRDQFRELYDSQLLGCNNPGLVATIPVVSALAAFVPFSFLRRLGKKTGEAVAKKPRRNAGLANTGEPARRDLAFGDLEVIDYCATPGVYRAVGLVIVATRFRGAVTLSIGFTERVIKRETAKNLLETIEKMLPTSR